MKKTRSTKPANPAKSFVGFWTWSKDELKRLAARRRQSMSALIDEIVEDYLAKWRRWR